MGTTAELDTSKYQVDEASADQFYNIVNFAKNMTVKDSKYFEEAETPLSKRFSELMIKYFDIGLTEQEVDELVSFIKDYNERESARLGFTTSETYIYNDSQILENRVKMLGLYSGQNFENSILNLILIALKDFNLEETEKNINEILSYIVYNYIDEENYIYSNLSDSFNFTLDEFNTEQSEWFSNYGKPNGENLEKIINISDFVRNKKDEETPEIYQEYLNSVSKINIIKIDNTDSENPKEEKSQLSYFYNESADKTIFKIPELKDGETINYKFNKNLWTISEVYEEGEKKEEKLKLSINKELTLLGYLDKLAQEINHLKECYLKKNKIFISDDYEEDSNGNKTNEIKRITSEEEKNLLKNSNIIFLNLCDGESQHFIIYKEFNKYYRSLFELDMIDLVLNFKFSGTPVAQSIFGGATNITNRMTSYLRNIRKTNILVRDFTNINMTTTDFKYIYGNPYFARKASESEIIKYFINCPRIPSTNFSKNSKNPIGYGAYLYEREEIYNFIDIYQSIHNYFYKVLLNESFINEKEYKIFEKTFLIFWSIERFISSKIDNLKDINLMDLNDVKNFLTSYGLEELAEIIEKNNFYNSESYAKNILKNFIKIVQNKGTHKVLNILQEIFSDTNSELIIFNSLLEYNKSESEENYYFIETLYDDENRLYSIFENDSKKIVMNDYTLNDNLWDNENINVELLKDLKVFNTQTKYLIPQLTEEISTSFFTARYVFAILDFIMEVIGNIADQGISFSLNVESKVFTESDLNIKKYLDLIRKYIETFIILSLNKNTTCRDLHDLISNGENIYTFKISDNLVNNDKYEKYFLIDNDNHIDINKNALRERFYLNEKFDSTINSFLQEVFNSIKPIFILQKLNSLKDQPSLVNEIFTTNIADEISGLFDLSRLAEILRIALIFPQYLYQGNAGNPLSSEKWMRSDLLIFLQELHDDLFMTVNCDKNILLKYEEDDDFNMESDIEKVIQKIIDACTELSNDVLNVMLQIRVSGTEESILTFLKETIDYFIAYSAMVYKTIYKVEYKNITEFLNVTDDICFMKTMRDIDSFYYDESLTIDLEEKGG